MSLIAACSGDDKSSPDDTKAPQATDSAPGASQGLAPLQPPSGFMEVSGGGFRLFAPADFTSERRTTSGGAPLLLLRRGGDQDTVVAVVRDEKPRSGALDQASTLETSKRLVDKATDVTRQEVQWPGAQKAVVVQWTVAKRSPTASSLPVRNVQLFTQVSDTLIFSVLATSPAESFERSQVETVLRTFQPQGVPS